MTNANSIVTQRYCCGPYTFEATMPRLGTSDDREEWTASAHGKEVPGRFDSLEDAMRAALSAAGK